MSWLKTDDINIYFEEYGSGKPLVLIHGAWLDHRMWRFQVSALSRHYRLILYDVRAHGKTSRGKEAYNMDTLAADLNDLLEGLGIDKAVIGGLSLGGMIAQRFAAKYPGKVSALMLINTAATTDLGWIEKLIKHVILPPPVFRFLIRLLGVSVFTRVAFKLSGIASTMNKKQLTSAGQDMLSYAKRELDKHTAESFSDVIGAVYGFTLQEAELTDKPVLLIRGGRDSFLVSRQMRKLCEVYPHASYVVVPEASHVPNIERPNAFNRALTGFFEIEDST